ncbi:uncharacterized protein LOC126680702 isoform X2 [Mercurialis annua]|uniref:uncharacterized protein LOC126680702 isoform X2 n=1 Tax=Mercurialis annua TaxID=3986 RepID=UPI00215F93F2|nr:uncharacterized protein LOC126680702 isoform X2 [Mercurialis annua]
MSGKGGGGGGGGKSNVGISGIPAGSRKMVQSLKEIVNCPETEIYAMLKDCNMDPNEAVNRLLAQDPFHEVKSKREKKKETKDTTDPRARVANNTTHRGGRGNADRYGRAVLSQFTSNDSGFSHGKPAYKKENGAHTYPGSSSASSVTGNYVNWRPAPNSDHVATENKLSTVGSSDGVSLSSQPPVGFQPAWGGVAGQVSMADIVKMGRPHNKASAVPPHHNINHHHPAPPLMAASNHDFHSSEHHSSKVSETNAEPAVSVNQHAHSNDEWPSIEPSAASMPSVLEAHSESELYTDPSNLHLDRVNQHMQSQFDDIQPTENDHIETLSGNHGLPSLSSRNLQDDGSVGSSMFDSNLYGTVGSYQPHRHAFEHEAEDGDQSVAANLQQLSLQDDDQSASSEEDNPSVIIPNHLQVHAQDCSHLSFGSFGSGIGSFSGPFASMPLNDNLEETSEVVDVPLAAHSDTRNTEYYGDEHLRSAADENLMHRAGMNPGNYESSAVQQAEVLKEDTSEAAQRNQYAFPSAAPGYTYENSQQLNAAFNNLQTSSQMQNNTPFSSVMAYTNSLPNTLLASTVQPGREPDLPYSPFPVAPSMPTKFSNTASSISGPSISMPEALRAPSISTPQPTQQSLPGASVATGPTLQQHLAVHPYSQPTLPLGPFTNMNMISYPYLPPQSYTYMPSAFQQTFAGNNTYHQSLAAAVLPPQYKNSVSVSSLPQSAAVASAYGFGSSTSIPTGNFPLNPPTAPGGTTLGYEDVLNSQYNKEANHMISLQQNENSAMWVHGPGSRTMSAVPGNTYYSFQGQNQQAAGYRQGQQQLSQQHFGALGYPNYFHNQTGMSLEHQQQNSRDASLGGSQGQQSKQSQQLWQNGY